MPQGPFTEVEIPLVGGEDTGTEPTAGVKPIAMENCWYQKGNGVRKRDGLDRVYLGGDPLQVPPTNSLRHFGGISQPANFTPVEMFDKAGQPHMRFMGSILKLATDLTPFYVDSCLNLDVRSSPIASVNQSTYSSTSSGTRQPATISSPDMAVNTTTGRILVCWIETLTDSEVASFNNPTYNVCIATFDPVDGELQPRLKKTIVASYTTGDLSSGEGDPKGLWCRAIYTTNFGLMCFVSNSSYGIDVYYNVTDTTYSTTALTTNPLVSGAFDVEADRSNPNRFAVLGQHNPGGIQVRVYSSPLLAPTATATLDAGFTEQCLSIDFKTEIYALWDKAAPSRVRAASITAAGAAISGSVTIDATCEAVSASIFKKADGTVLASYTLYDPVLPDEYIQRYLVPATMATVNTPFRSGFVYALTTVADGPTGHPASLVQVAAFGSMPADVENGGPPVLSFLPPAANDSNTKPSPISVLSSAPSASSNLPKDTGSLAVPGWNLPRIRPYGGNLHTVQLVQARPDQAFFDLVGYASTTFSDYTHAEVGNCTMISGGIPRVFDGYVAHEACHFSAPTKPVVVATAGGAMTSGATYGVAVVFSARDKDGNQIRSAPNFSDSVTVSGANLAIQVQGHIPYITNFLNSQTPITIELYRTQANGSVFYFEKEFITSWGTPTFYTTSVGTSDSLIRSNEQLYTTGGQLDNVCPPSSRYVTEHQGRFWLSGTPDDTIWFSKEFIVGEIPGFSEGLTVQPFEGGRVTALAGLDSNMIVFKEGSIYSISGRPPNDTGADSSLSLPPLRLASDTGCVDPRSLAEIPSGLLFRGRRGFYLLSRSLQVQYIGKPVEARVESLGASWRVTQTQVFPDRSMAVFFGTGSEAFAYDYLNDSWSVFLYNVNGVTGSVETDAGTRFLMDESGSVFQINPNSCTDVGAFVPMTYRTQFIHSGPALDWQRIRRVSLNGRKLTDVDSTITLYRDYDDTFNEARSFASDTAGWNTAANTPRNMQVDPSRQKLAAVSVRYSDAAPTGSGHVTGTGMGFALNSISLEIMPLNGPKKLPSGQVK